jgi:hypothetical protein
VASHRVTIGASKVARPAWNSARGMSRSSSPANTPAALPHRCAASAKIITTEAACRTAFGRRDAVTSDIQPSRSQNSMRESPNSVFTSGGCSRLLSVARGPPKVSVIRRSVATSPRKLARSTHQRAYFAP